MFPQKSPMKTAKIVSPLLLSTSAVPPPVVRDRKPSGHSIEDLFLLYCLVPEWKEQPTHHPLADRKQGCGLYTDWLLMY